MQSINILSHANNCAALTLTVRVKDDQQQWQLAAAKLSNCCLCLAALNK